MTMNNSPLCQGGELSLQHRHANRPGTFIIRLVKPCFGAYHVSFLSCSGCSRFIKVRCIAEKERLKEASR